MDQFVDPGSFEAALDQTVDNALHQMRRRGEAFFFFQAEDGIRDWRDWSSDVCSSDLRTRPDVERGYTAPALTFMCVLGFLASAAAIVMGFVPPSQFENGSPGAYVGLILAGTVLLGLLPPWLFLKRRKPSWKVADGEEV